MATSPATTASTTVPPEHSSGGLPQFDPTWWPGQIVWFVVIFALVFALMAKVFVPKLGGTIGAREDRISGDIAQARKLKEEAEAQAAAASAETRQARARVEKTAAEARSRAAAETAAVQAAEDAKLAANLATAEVSIRAARDQAMANVRAIAQDTASSIIEKLTGEKAGTAEVSAALGKA